MIYGFQLLYSDIQAFNHFGIFALFMIFVQCQNVIYILAIYSFPLSLKHYQLSILHDLEMRVII